MSASLALQTALFSKLTTQFAASSVTAALVAHPVADQALPYVSIGQVTAIRDHEIGEEFELQIDVFSRTDGPHEVKTIQAAIRSALHGLTFDQSPYRITAMRVFFTTVFIDPTDDVWQGVQRIRALAS